MKGRHQGRRRNYMPIAFVCTAAVLFFSMVSATSGESSDPSLASPEVLRLGERMYREGILPSGEPMQSFVKGDIPVAGTAFTCVSCHLRSGLGSFEGGVITPPTNGGKLFQPVKAIYKGSEIESAPLRRPAYTDASLADAIRGGADPKGRILNDVMPRYVLDDRDMAVLISYLKSLSSKLPPGVSDNTISFATVIGGDVRPEDRDAMLAPLENYLSIKNTMAEFSETKAGARARRMSEKMVESKELITRKLTLSRWVLHGPPETWRRQLEDYYRKEPVFGLLGGITNGEWKPIHEFTEDMQIPSLFPITDFPVISETDWYTLYFSKGYYQEGEAAARYLNGRSKGGTILQVVRDSPEGRALSAGFLKTWADFGQPQPVTITLKPAETLTMETLSRVLDQDKPVTLILWVGPEALPVLEMLASGRNRPETVFIAASDIGKSLWALPEQVREFTYITYPFAFTKYVVKASMGGPVAVQDDVQNILSRNDVPVKDRAQKISDLTNFMTRILTMALMDMKGNYYRDNFFDVISMVADQQSQVYGRLSFGPGQRYASKGCYVVQLTKGPGPELIKRSEWIIH